MSRMLRPRKEEAPAQRTCARPFPVVHLQKRRDGDFSRHGNIKSAPVFLCCFFPAPAAASV